MLQELQTEIRIVERLYGCEMQVAAAQWADWMWYKQNKEGVEKSSPDTWDERTFPGPWFWWEVIFLILSHFYHSVLAVWVLYLVCEFIKCNSTASSQHHSSYGESLPCHSFSSMDSASMGLAHSVVRIFKTTGLTNIKPSLSTLTLSVVEKKKTLFIFLLLKFFMTQVRKWSPVWVDPLKTPREISTFTFL